MPSKMIYISEENYPEFEKLENRSQVINKLLSEYFNNSKSLKERHEEIKKQAEELSKEAEVLEKEIEVEDEQLEKTQEELQKEREAYEQTDEYWDKIKDLQLEALKNYDIPKDQIHIVLDEFMALLKTGLVKNLIQYAEEAGLKKKTKKNDAVL